jgi:hypothetical protein
MAPGERGRRSSEWVLGSIAGRLENTQYTETKFSTLVKNARATAPRALLLLAHS